MSDVEQTMSAVWMSDQSTGHERVVDTVHRVLARDRFARERERRYRAGALLAVALLVPALLWAAAYGVTPLVRGAYALMAVGSGAIAAAEWVYLDWSRQALPGPLDTRTQLQTTAFILARQAMLMRTAPIWSSPIFVGVALIGVWLFLHRTLAAALMVWAIALVGGVAGVWGTRSLLAGLSKRRMQIERLQAEL